MKYLLYLTTALLIVGIFPQAAGYITVTNAVISVVFAYCGVLLYRGKQEGAAYFCLILALLFQPLLRLPLGDMGWKITHGVVAGILVIFLFADSVVESIPKIGKKANNARKRLFRSK